MLDFVFRLFARFFGPLSPVATCIPDSPHLGCIPANTLGM